MLNDLRLNSPTERLPNSYYTANSEPYNEISSCAREMIIVEGRDAHGKLYQGQFQLAIQGSTLVIANMPDDVSSITVNIQVNGCKKTYTLHRVELEEDFDLDAQGDNVQNKSEFCVVDQPQHKIKCTKQTDIAQLHSAMRAKQRRSIPSPLSQDPLQCVHVIDKHKRQCRNRVAGERQLCHWHRDLYTGSDIVDVQAESRRKLLAWKTD